MKKRILLSVLVMIATFFNTNTKTAFATTTNNNQKQAAYTISNVLIDGELTSFDTYTIDDSNYFKIRDLAFVLNGSSKNFEVAWYGEKQAINIITNTPYTITGSEISTLNGETKTAITNTAKILVNGDEVDITAYNIDNSSYFELRDICKHLDIDVTLNSATNTIGIITTNDANKTTGVLPKKPTNNKAYLYGETHGNSLILEKEFEIWNDYYHKDNLRHLFVELPFYTAEYMNIWMQEDDDKILDQLFEDMKDTLADTQESKEFYIKIKEQCPETVFHGIDVGHQYQTTGKRFSEYLSKNNLEKTEEYKITQEAIEQGKKYYDENNNDYRETMLVDNFKHEFNKLSNENIMGIFGSLHTNIGGNITDTTKNMATQLTEHYGDNITSESLVHFAKEIDSLKTDVLTLGLKEYEAEYFGKEDMSAWLPNYSHREFWKLVNAFDYFKDAKPTENVLPQSNYPMNLEKNNIYIVDYTMKDGTLKREVHRYDGEFDFQGNLATEQILIPEVLTINGFEYEAEYLGQFDISALPNYSHRAFWKLVNAFDDFSTNPTTGDNLPQSNYPVELENNAIYVVDYTYKTGEVERQIHRSNGTAMNGQTATQQIKEK